MGQLEIFTSAQISGMRDRTRAPNYSPERERFRREQARRREVGLARRHAQKLYHLWHHDADPEPPGLPAGAEHHALPAAATALISSTRQDHPEPHAAPHSPATTGTAAASRLPESGNEPPSRHTPAKETPAATA